MVDSKSFLTQAAPFFLISLTSVFGVLGNVDPVPGAIYFALLPLLFGINLVFFWRVFDEAKRNIVLLVFLVVLFMRFVVTPILFSFSSSFSLPIQERISGEVLFWAFILLCCDLFFSFLVAHLAIAFYSTRKKEVRERSKSADGLVLLLIAMIPLAALVMNDPSVLTNYRFFLLGSEQFHDFSKAESGGFAIVALDLLVVLVPLFFLKFFKLADGGDERFIYFALSLLVVVGVSLFVKGVSRFSVLVPTLSWMIVVTVLYPKYSKTAKRAIGILALVALGFLTLYKNFRADSLGQIEAGLSMEMLALMWNAYFASLFNMAYAIDVFLGSTFIDRVGFLVNDILVNLAYFSQLADASKTSVAAYNFSVYGTSEVRDQIVPMTGQGLLHFGVFFPFFWMGFSVFLMVWFSFLLKLERNLGYVYILAYLSLYLAMSGMLSWNSVYPRFFNFAMPLFFIVFLSERFRLGASRTI